MERDPQTRTERERAAAEQAAATAAGEGEATDGVHGTAGTDEVPVAPPDGDSASAPEAGAAAAGVAQAADNAPEPEAEPKAAEPDYKDQYLRAMAELDTVRKRAAREAAVAGERAKSGLVRELLPIVDNLERALASAEDGEQHLAEGVRMVHAQLVAALEREGIQAFDPAGEQFDPECHEALSMRSENGCEQGVVLDVVEKGYRLNGAVLRPARVVVSG